MPDRKPIGCPLCGEPLPRGGEECPNCGAAVSETALRDLMRALKIDSETAHALFRTGVRTAGDLAGQSVDDALKERGSGVLYLCPECGAFVSSADRACAKCGAQLADEAMDLGKFLEEGGTKACPACGEAIPSDARVCPACRTQIAEAPEGVEGTTLLCANCGATILPDQTVCESCGEPARGISGTPPPAEKGAVCPTCGAVVPIAASTCETCGSDLGRTPVRDREMEALEKILDDATSAKSEEESVVEDLDRLAHDLEADAVPEPSTAIELEAPPEARAREPGASAEAPAGPRSVRAAAELKVSKLAAPGRPRSSPVARFREAAMVGTLAALAPAAYVAVNPSEVGRWTVLALAGSLFATAVALLFLDPRPFRRYRMEWGLAATGGLLILAVPVHAAAGLLLPEAVDIGILVAGLLLILVPAGRSRAAEVAPAQWTGALPGFLGMAAAIAVNRPTGSALVSAAVWAALGIAAGASVGLLAWGRWVDTRVAVAVDRAEGLARRREYRESIVELDRAIRLSGEASDVPWYSKGAALVVLGRYEEALSCIDTALRINPRNEVAWVNKGNALVRMGRLLDSLKCYNSAIKVNPRYEVAWNNKGNGLARLGKFDDALKCYERALEIDAEYRGAWVNKGYVLTKLGDFEAAARCADEVLRLGGPGGVAA